MSAINKVRQWVKVNDLNIDTILFKTNSTSWKCDVTHVIGKSTLCEVENFSGEVITFYISERLVNEIFWA